MAAINRIPGSWWLKSAVAGIIGALVMGIYSMMTALAAGGTLWAPLNMIATAVPAFRPMTPDFDFGPTMTGLLIHMATGALWGLALGALAAYGPQLIRGFGFALATGIGLGIVAWLVTGLLIGPVVAPAMLMANPLNYFISHLIFGVTTALVLSAWIGRKEQHTVVFAREERPVIRR